MSSNLSTVESYGVGFERTGIPFIPRLSDTDQLPEEVEEQVSQLPQQQSTSRREDAKSPSYQSDGFRLASPTDVLGMWVQTGRFEGRLIIPDAPFVFPPQQFEVSLKAGKILIKSHPIDEWPQILLEFAHSHLGGPTVEKVQFRPSGNSVESEVLYTRAHYTVSQIGSYLLASEITPDDEVIGISFTCQPLTSEQATSILHRAKIARKLRFIERIFNLSERLPEDITPDHVQYIEQIFRGLTEGEFTTRGDAITLRLRAVDVDLSAPPFSEAGRFEYLLGNEQALLFQRDRRYTVLDMGPIYLELQRAAVANGSQISRLRNGQDSTVRFEVLDSQIGYNYKRYAQTKRHKQLQHKLEHFHRLLSSQEPTELAATLFEPLISDVRSDQAIKITVGWLQYHDFPDRFSPQEPTLDREMGYWRVPIYVVYADGKSAPVGELFIDLKTGSIIDEPSPDQMFQNGLVLGKKILRVV